jgi:hypothetical protein
MKHSRGYNPLNISSERNLNIMALSKDDKDEIRLLIAREIRDVIKNAATAVENMSVELGAGRHLMSSEDHEKREAEKKMARRVGKVVLDAAEANLREADARIVEKTDPERAERIRRLVPEF